MKKRGISLITLVVTIIIIIILAAAVILTINNNNPLSNASKATLQSDLKSFQEALQLYIGQKSIENAGTFQTTSLRANETILITTQSQLMKRVIFIPFCQKRRVDILVN